MTDTSVVSAELFDYHMLRIESVPNAFGETSLIITAANQFRTSVQDSVNITVSAVDDEPVLITELNLMLGRDIQFDIPFEFEDVDSDSLVFSFSDSAGLPAWLNFENSSLNGLPSEVGFYEVPFQLSNQTNSYQYVMTFQIENFKPIITSIEDVPSDQVVEFMYHLKKHSLITKDISNQSYSIFRYDTFEDSLSWVNIASGDAIGENSCIFEVSTLLTLVW